MVPFSTQRRGNARDLSYTLLVMVVQEEMKHEFTEILHFSANMEGKKRRRKKLHRISKLTWNLS